MPQVEGRGKQRLKTRLHHLTRSIKLVRRDPTDLALPYTEFSTNFVFSFLSLSLLSSEAHGRITGSHRIRDPVPEAGQRGTRAALWHVGRQFYKCRKESVRLLFPVFWEVALTPARWSARRRCQRLPHWRRSQSRSHGTGQSLCRASRSIVFSLVFLVISFGRCTYRIDNFTDGGKDVSQRVFIGAPGEVPFHKKSERTLSTSKLDN